MLTLIISSTSQSSDHMALYKLWYCSFTIIGVSNSSSSSSSSSSISSSNNNNNNLTLTLLLSFNPRDLYYRGYIKNNNNNNNNDCNGVPYRRVCTH